MAGRQSYDIPDKDGEETKPSKGFVNPFTGKKMSFGQWIGEPEKKSEESVEDSDAMDITPVKPSPKGKKGMEGVELATAPPNAGKLKPVDHNQHGRYKLHKTFNLY